MPPKIIWPAHDSPGRLRFRLSWLHDGPADGEPIAEALAAVPGVREVRVRAYTGSVLLLYDPARIDADRLTRALLAATGVEHITQPGEETLEDLHAWIAESVHEGSALTQALAEAGRGLHKDFLRLTDGHASVGSATTVLFWLAAAGRIAASGRLDLPAWHELVYWGFRTFGTLEGEAIERRSAKIASQVVVEEGNSHG
jgi:hypothetical protein